MKKFGLSVLLSSALAMQAAAFDLSNMNEAEQDAFGAAVRAYLLENPQVIMEAVAVLEAQEVAAQAEADKVLVAENAAALFEDGYSFVGGNPEGDITLVEFLDYRCGFCRKAHPEVDRLLKEDGNVRFIIKEFPILGEQSETASRFAIATKHVAGDESYKAVSDALIAFSGQVSQTNLSRLADHLELDKEQIFDAMASEAVSAEIEATRALAERLQITGTPTFVMQDELIRGFVPYAGMVQMLSEKRSGQ
jgi:protein-disulfide isomerase